MQCPACKTNIPDNVINELEDGEIFDCAECDAELQYEDGTLSVVADEDFDDEDEYEDIDEED